MDTILRFERKDEGSIPSGGTIREIASFKEENFS